MRNFIVGVQGPSAAGKSTLAGRLAAELRGTVVHELAESADWAPGTLVGVPSHEQELLVNRRVFLDYECRRWARAISLAVTRPAVFDTEWIGQLSPPSFWIRSARLLRAALVRSDTEA